MILPNKLFSYEESVLSKLPQILSCIVNGVSSITGLYQSVKDSLSDIDEFFEALDVLFALNSIDINEQGRIIYVNRD